MKLVLLTAVLFAGYYSAATGFAHSTLPDTIIDRPAYALTQHEFLERYGRDDSSKALINFFFRKRSPVAGLIGSGVPVTILSSIGLAVAVHGVKTESNSLGEQIDYGILALFTGVALGGGVALLSLGTATGIKYSRKRLLLLLNNYFTGSPIPRHVAKSTMFRAFVQFGEWNARTKRKIKSMGRIYKAKRRR
jgi:hypothetical protein